MAVRPSARARERLRLAIDTEGWTQRELAQRVGKSQPWLVKILSGENSLRLDDLDPMAKALGVPPAELIREPDGELAEVTPLELKALRALRALAPDQRVHFLAVLDAVSRNVQASEKRRHLLTRSSITNGVDLATRDAPALRPTDASISGLRALLTQLSLELAATAARLPPDQPIRDLGTKAPGRRRVAD